MGDSRLAVHLLGVPSIERDGRGVAPPRGRKSWGLLAYLLLSERAPSREHLGALLFPDADDPSAALRWTLSELRRALGPGVVLNGNPVRLTLAPFVLVDAHVLTRSSWREAVRLRGLEQDLLETAAPSGSAAFELWLADERRRIRRVAASVLREAAHASLARADAATAVGYASRLAAVEPLDENHHALLVRSLCRAGRREDAAEHVRRATALLEHELGIAPSPAVRRAMVVDEVGQVAGTGAILARLDRGEASVAAGALDEGLLALRSAAASALVSGEPGLRARALVSLGHALVHAARGGDEEGAAALHEAAVLAGELGDDRLGAAARRGLAWVELFRGRYDRLLPLLDEAAVLAGADEAELAWLDLIRGGALTETSQYAAAAAVLRDAVARSQRLGAADAGGVAWSMVGRLHLLRGDLPPAREALERGVELARLAGWLAFVPFPEALLGEVDLLEGDLERAAARFEHAYALGHEVDDPCWESIATRGLGLVAASRGDDAEALRLLAEAPVLCRRLPDSSRWIEAYALDALCSFAVERAVPGCSRWVQELESLAAAGGMRELVARAAVHRARLGVDGAFEVAAVLAGSLDSARLDGVVAAGPGEPSRLAHG